MVDDLGGFFRCHFLRRPLFVFGRLQTLKIELPPRREHNFYKIDFFKNGLENGRFGRYFGKLKRYKINKNMYTRTFVFSTSNFLDFFFDFDTILGGRDVPAWSLHSPYKSLETLIFRMLGRIAAQESYQGRF